MKNQPEFQAPARCIVFKRWDQLTPDDAPMKKFERMVRDMEESFLITGSWAKVQRRLNLRAE